MSSQPPSAQSNSGTTGTPRGPPPGEKKVLTKAERRELQERQRAEKAAKQAASSSSKPAAAKQQGQSQAAKPKGKQQEETSSHHRHTSSKSGKEIIDAVKLAQSESGAPSLDSLRIFSHFGLPKPMASIGAGIKGEIHPAVRKLGLQFADFRITGANARCIATLTVFKTVIQDYVTPQGTTLSRHLMTHLSPQISYLVAARPMSMSMGNAIRYLKYEISILSIDLPEQDAKDFLCDRIDTFIRERVTVADQVIQSLAMEKIQDGDVILTYAKSSVVEKTLLSASSEGKQFSVMVVDSRPLSEGKQLLQSLTEANIPTTYALISSLPTVLATVSTVLLGTHALHSNGALYSRSGTALVAMMAKAQNVPVLVCCETYKFSDGILLDSFMKNELAPLDLSAPPVQSPPSNKLQVVNPLYDLTPHTNITAVVTEVGLIPASAVPTVLSRALQGAT
ncbi:hypothetical protein FRC03_002403 [Tulasnella sp. 419]|nr:hypothetical protein FRC03_002403 [Tulasnella sp. 419]